MSIKITFKHELKPSDKIDPKSLIDLILFHRQIKDIKEFLNPKSPLSISLLDFDSKYKKFFTLIIKLLKDIKKKSQMIVVYTDYDADGITGGAILWETLYLLGFKAMPYVPNRKTEGYGFSIVGIDNVIKKFNPALIISVDHGITKVKEIEYAKKKGVKIIVTDHHLKAEKTPKADAIFHIPALSGSGVAYFFAKEIFKWFISHPERNEGSPTNVGNSNKLRDSSPSAQNDKLPNYFEVDYLVLASIGTIADLVPLIGPSRSIVKYGLEAFTKVKRYGIRHILKEAGIEGKKITPYDIGFIIAPRINAVGRLENAINALRLLCTTKEKKAYELAHRIGKKNVERQDLVEKSVDEAKDILKAKCANLQTPNGVEAPVCGTDSFTLGGFAKTRTSDQNLPKLIILTSNSWHEGIIGLIASKIADEFYRPTIVLTKNDGFYKGSARSIPGFNITDFLRSLKGCLIDVGGHKAAAGFTIEKKKLTIFETTASKMINKLLKNKDLERKIKVDLKIPLLKIDIHLVKELEKLQPFGIGNPQPTFYSQAKVIGAKIFGKTNKHLKIWVTDLLHSQGINLELISFNQASQFHNLSRGSIINIVYSLEINRWGGSEKLRGKAVYFIAQAS